MRDPKTENYMSAGNYRFEFRAALPIADIDMQEAKANPARLSKRLDDDRVMMYGVAMLDGTDFPAVVVFNVGTSKFKLCTGLHRLSAALEAKLKTFDAYIVMEADEYRRELLMRSINTIEGKAPDLREQLNHTMEMLRLFPDAPVKDLAAAFHLKPETIHGYQRLIAAEDRAVRLGVADLVCGTAMPQLLKVEAARIPNDNTFVRVVNAISLTKAKGVTADALVRSAKAAKTEEAAARVVDEHVKQWHEEEARNRSRFGRTPTATSTRFMGKVRSVTKVTNLTKLALGGIVPEKLPSSIRLVEQAIELLDKVLASLRHRQEQIDKANETWDNITSVGRTEGVLYSKPASGNR